MAYPADTGTIPTNQQGTSLLATIDHAAGHAQLGSASNAIVQRLGYPAGTPSSNQILVGYAAGTTQWQGHWDNGTLGTATLQAPTINGQGTNSGTINNGIYNAATISGQSAISGTLSGGMIGTTTVKGGTLSSVTIVGTNNTISALGTSMFQTGQFARLLDNSQNFQMQFGTVLGTFSAGTLVTGTITFAGTFSTACIAAFMSANHSSAIPISDLIMNPYTLGTNTMLYELRSLGGTSNDVITLSYMAIGY